VLPDEFVTVSLLSRVCQKSQWKDLTSGDGLAMLVFVGFSW